MNCKYLNSLKTFAAHQLFPTELVVQPLLPFKMKQKNKQTLSLSELQQLSAMEEGNERNL